MWEFPNARVDGDPARELVKALRGATRLKVQKKEPLGFVQHAYSHFRVIVYPFLCAKVEAPKDKKFKWVPLDELDDYPMGKVDRQIAKKVVGQA
jgi:A/G-specific adenine glycosylase